MLHLAKAERSLRSEERVPNQAPDPPVILLDPVVQAPACDQLKYLKDDLIPSYILFCFSRD
jgi:hypothetical protein